MPAGDQQPQGRIGHLTAKSCGHQVGVEVVHANKRLARSQAQSLGRRQSHEQAAEQPRPPGHGHGVHRRQGQAGFGKKRIQKRPQAAQMLP